MRDRYILSFFLVPLPAADPFRGYNAPKKFCHNYSIFCPRFTEGHGVFIWLTASTRFQRCTSLKTSPPCQPDGPEQGTQPTIPSIQRPQTSPHMARRPVGTLREHGGRGLGAMPRPLAASHCSALCHCSPAFFDAGATATKSPLSASTTDTSPTTSSTNLPSAARCRASFPCCAAIHFESRAA